MCSSFYEILRSSLSVDLMSSLILSSSSSFPSMVLKFSSSLIKSSYYLLAISLLSWSSDSSLFSVIFIPCSLLLISILLLLLLSSVSSSSLFLFFSFDYSTFNYPSGSLLFTYVYSLIGVYSSLL